MNRIQKIAFYNIIIILTTMLITGISIGMLYIKFGFPKASAGLACLGIFGFLGFGPLIFKRDKGSVTCDERDILINRKAANAGFATAFLVVGLSCMLPFFVLGPNHKISITWLPMIFMTAGLSTYFVHSLAILIQYGRGGKSNE